MDIRLPLVCRLKFHHRLLCAFIFLTLFINKIIKNHLGSSPYDRFLENITNSQIHVAKYSFFSNKSKIQTTSTTTTTTTTKPPSTTTITKTDDPIDVIFENGKWEDWEEHGFEREVYINGTLTKITNPLDPNYPTDVWPPYKLWTQQNFTGKWTIPPENNKNGYILHRFNKQELANCFNSGLNRIAVVGDSRGRQFTRSVKLYLEGVDSPWDDRVRHAGFNDNVPKVAELKFYWSSSFIPKYNDWKMGGHLSDALKTGWDGNSSLIIVGQHVIHPIHWLSGGKDIVQIEYFNKTLKKMVREPVKNDTSWTYENVVKPFVSSGLLKKVLTALNEQPWLKIVFLAAQYPIRFPKEIQPHSNKYIEAYNFYMKDIIKSQNHERLKWFEASTKIGLSPNGVPLTPDGTHLNWNHEYMKKTMKLTDKEIKNQKLKMTASHMAMNDVIFNWACKDFVPEVIY